jgi:hypothetical protein
LNSEKAGKYIKTKNIQKENIEDIVRDLCVIFVENMTFK